MRKARQAMAWRAFFVGTAGVPTPQTLVLTSSTLPLRVSTSQL
jgi:hypothetical protein